jgi:cation-transporting ATPase F
VEVVLGRCTGTIDAQGARTSLDRIAVMAAVAELAGAGMRVLAFARAEVGSQAERLDVARLPEDFVFLGLQGMIDPPRPEAMKAVAVCQRAGIRVAMITGDHAGTALAIGRQLGLVPETVAPGTPSVLTGRELATLRDDALTEAAEKVSIFAGSPPSRNSGWWRPCSRGAMWCDDRRRGQ